MDSITNLHSITNMDSITNIHRIINKDSIDNNDSLTNTDFIIVINNWRLLIFQKLGFFQFHMASFQLFWSVKHYDTFWAHLKINFSSFFFSYSAFFMPPFSGARVLS